MQTKIPARKVTAGALIGALVTILVWALNTFVLSAEQQITGEIAAAITTVITFVVGYFVRPSQIDNVIQESA
jgi:low affinity Fe/Cu permease